ncbi:MAG: hypothetical protein QG644_389, partial [Patescibacteria group bacterium]|nr:hypothetical protein [Patescibacteria group bacterium]
TILVIPFIPIKGNTDKVVNCSNEKISEEQMYLPYMPICYEQKTEYRNILDFIILKIIY